MSTESGLIRNTGGPYAPERTVEVANLAAEAIRYLNHATLGWNVAEALRYPADMDRVVSGLATMAMRLPQLLEQLGAWLDAEQEGGHLTVVSGKYAGRPGLAADVIRMRLEVAAARFKDAREALDAAHQITAAIAAADGADDDDA